MRFMRRGIDKVFNLPGFCLVCQQSIAFCSHGFCFYCCKALLQINACPACAAANSSAQYCARCILQPPTWPMLIVLQPAASPLSPHLNAFLSGRRSSLALAIARLLLLKIKERSAYACYAGSLAISIAPPPADRKKAQEAHRAIQQIGFHLSRWLQIPLYTNLIRNTKTQRTPVIDEILLAPRAITGKAYYLAAPSTKQARIKEIWSLSR